VFTLDTRLQHDTIPAGDFPLSRLLLMNDRTYPWLILVPRRPGISEIFQLGSADQAQLLGESVQLSRALHTLCQPDKLNIAALGNVVPQLHLHHVARYRTDPAWPAPIWGRAPAVPYAPHEAQVFLQQLIPLLSDFTPATSS
jgi:diadenosine tetraphosphate (Ap4A) HIT family hydrolase